jgi:hypothetical protein
LILAAATAFDALRAGAGTFRLLIDLPSRSRIGSVAFAEFSRATDLSTTGIVFYGLYGIGGALLTGFTWFAAQRARAPRTIRRLTAGAFVSSVLILAATTQAAPLMWHVGESPNDPAVLAQLLDRFAAWTTFRILCGDLSFAMLLCALTLFALRPDNPTIEPAK